MWDNNPTLEWILINFKPDNIRIIRCRQHFLPLNLRIVWLDPFPNVSYLFVVYVCNDYHWTNQNHCLKMGWTIHLSDAYDAFSSSCFYFSLVLSLMTMNPKNQMRTDQGQGSLLVRASCYVLNYLLIKSFDRLVKSFLIESQYSWYFPAQILL